MPYVQLDENRNQISYSKWDDIGIKVDCCCPGEWCVLKVDYEDFSGEDQWEMNLECIRLQKIREIKSERSNLIYGVAWVDVGDSDEQPFLLDMDNRQILIQKAQSMSLFSADIDATFYDGEMPKIKLSDETWITVPPAKCLPWAKQVEFLTQMGFNKEQECQESINDFRDEVIAETKTLQEFIDFDFITQYNTNLKTAVADHTKFAYPEQYYNEI